MSGSFDVESLLSSAAAGKVAAPPVVSAPPSDGIPTMTISPGGADSEAAAGTGQAQGQTAPVFDVSDLLRKATTGDIPAPPKAPQSAGMASNFAAGANRAIGGPVDLATWAINQGIHGVNAGARALGVGPKQTLSGLVTGQQPTGLIPDITNPVGGSDWIGKLAGTDQVQPTNELESMAGAAGGAVAQVPMMGMGAAAVAPRLAGAGRGIADTLVQGSGAGGVGQAARTGIQAATGGAAGQGAADVAPDDLKPYADILGNVAGAGAIGFGENFARDGFGMVARKAGTTANIGRKQNIGGASVTNAQVQQTGEQLANGIGPTGRANIARSVDDEATAKELEAQLADPNLHPGDRPNIERQLKALSGTRAVLVPGSEPTTAELANTAGAQDLEQAAKKVNAPAFVERNTQRNNARVGAIENAADAPDSVPSPPVAQGNPQTLGQVVTDRLRQIEADGQQNVASAKAGVQSNPLQDAGTEPISATGAKLRQTLKAAADPWIQAYRRAWAAVDPDGTWAIRSGPLRDVGEELASQVKPYSQTDGQTDALVNAARTISPTVKFSDLAQMRKAANAALARLTGERGYEPEVYRLGRVKGAIDSTIAASIDEKAKVDPGLGSRLQELADEPGQGNATRNGAVGPQAVPAENVAVSSEANGGGGAGQAGRGGASGNSGVPSGAAAGQGTAAQRPPARPPSLVDFLISRGGIKNEGGDLNEDLQAIHHQMGGRLINNKSGMQPDYAREAAVEEGYLPQSADINTLKDALAEHARGNPTYRGADIAQQQEWEAGQRATRTNAAFDAKLYDARDTVNTWAEQNGVRLSRQEQDDAAHLVATGVHVEDAMRSAVRDGEDRALQNNAQMNAFGQAGVPLAEHQATMDVTGSPRIQPNMTEENAATYAAANKATADYKERYRRGGVGNVLQEGRNHEDFRIAEGNVPRQIFTGNNVEPAEVDRFITAVGQDKAQEIGRDVLVNDLRSKNIINPDGDVNETKLGRWLSARSATLERFPELKKQFGDLKSAQATVNDAMAKDVADRKAFQDSVAGRIIGADPRNAVQKILSGANPEANMRQLVDQIKDNPDAVASLKRMVTDYITEKHSSATPSTDGFDMLKADGLRRFIKQYKEPLRVLFGGQGLQNLEMIGADLRRQASGPNALAGSQTAAHGARSARTGIGVSAHDTSGTILALVMERIGELAHSGLGIVAAGAGFAAAPFLNSMKQAAIRNRNDLASFAMLHPEVAKALMEKADAKKAMSLAAKKRIGAAMRTAIMADMGSDGEQKK